MNNLHVAVIHFPIAFILLYGVLELFWPLRKTAYGFYTKAVLIIAGTLGTWAALLTAPDGMFRNDPSLRQVMHMHENFGQLTTILATAIAAVYAVAWLSRSGFRPIPWLARLCVSLSESAWMVIPALGVMTLVSITGALGGVLVFGPDVDPMTHFVYGLFF